MKNVLCSFSVMFISLAVYAGPYEDCVLSGIKGVSGDAAANAVKQACRTKVNEARKVKQEAVGLPLRDTEYEWDNNSRLSEEGGYFSQFLKNKSQNKLITYFSLEIRDSDYNDYKQKNYLDIYGETEWQKERSSTYFYKLALKPGGQIRLLYPKPRTEKAFWAKARSVLGREPKWSDSISTSAWSDKVRPEAKDPLE